VLFVYLTDGLVNLVLDVGNVILKSRDDAFDLTTFLFQTTGFPLSRLKIVF